MATVTAQDGQSIYDLCLMAYGTLDLIVKFCSDNNINDVNYTPKSGAIYSYEPLLVENQQIEGIRMAAAYKP